MAHFALIENGAVATVIVADQAFINAFRPKSENWVQTSYNTRAGQHTKGGTPLRKNYAGIGFAYDADRDAFIPAKPFNSWLLDEGTANWNAPINRPAGDVSWDEKTGNWNFI